MFLEEAKRIAWLSFVQIMLYTSSDVIQLPLVFLEDSQIFLELLQGPFQTSEFRIVVGRHRGTGYRLGRLRLRGGRTGPFGSGPAAFWLGRVLSQI